MPVGGFMARFHSRLTITCAIALLLTLPVALGGCAGALVVGGLAVAAGGGYAAAQERGVDGATNDMAIKTSIEAQLIARDPQLQAGITTTVFGGRVLLTGRVADPALKAAADQIASSTQNVRALHDELEVASPETAWDDAKDAWITTRVRSEMVFDPDIRSVNYTIDTANGSVYLIGSARSQAELDRATRIARYVPGVKRVVSYVELRGSAPVAAMPSTPPGGSMGGGPPGSYSAPYRGGAAPRSPIEVQKL
jgi:osmotically-inducible protein OsmY